MTVDRSRPFAWYRVAILLVVVVLGAVTLLANRGPLWFQRYYHPLQNQAEIAAASKRFGVDPYLIAGVMKVESGFDADIVSRKGAVGLMQVLPSTAEELHTDAKLGLPSPTPAVLRDPAANTLFGTAYIGQLIEDFDDTRTALAAYNAGPNNVEKWLHRPGKQKITYADVAFPETKRYVKKVLFEAYYYRRLYPEAFK
jgi:soluble lytic murein transglycosylase